MAHILVIDDEEDILALIKRGLSKDNHLVVTKTSAKDLDDGYFFRYDLIILDVMMPDMDGFELCKRIRRLVDCPILFLTAKTLEEDVLYGLSIGGDDYIKKPFSMKEFRGRVMAHIRRENREKTNYYAVGNCRFDLHSQQMYYGEELIQLTKSEYAITEFLARHRGQIFSKDAIYETIFGYEGESDSSCITEHIKNIRKKIGAYGVEQIKTMWGVGYKWEC